MPTWDAPGDFAGAQDDSGIAHTAIGGNTDRGALRVGYPFGSLTRGLVGYYPFLGDATDATGLGNDGTVSGATFVSDGGPFGDGAYTFDGTDNSIGIGASILSDGPATIAAWVYPTSWSDGVIVSGHDPELIRTDGGDSVFYAFSANIQGISGSLNAWNHLVAVDDGAGTVRAFIDGSEAGSTSGSPSGTSDWVIGVRNDDNRWFNGDIGSVRVYDRALSNGEIAALAQLTSPSTVTTEDTLA